MTLGEAAQKAGVAITFPIPVGDHKMSFTQAVPSIGILKVRSRPAQYPQHLMQSNSHSPVCSLSVVQVTVKGHVTVADGKGAQLGCIDIDFKI